MTLLIKNIDCIGTFDDEDRILYGGSILVDGCKISKVGNFKTDGVPVDDEIDGGGRVALPGFVNTHHHFFQQLTRAYPPVHSCSVADWLFHLHPIWGEMDEEGMYFASLSAAAELLLTGCTTTSDMTYFFPYSRTSFIDIEIQATSEIGIRFHPMRGSMPRMEGDLADRLEKAGFPGRSLTEKTDFILSDCERVIKRYHDPGRYSMCRVVVGPTDKTYDQPGFMQDLADLARRHGVSMHTHLHPRRDEVAMVRERFGKEPIDFLDDVGWLGKDVWFAHATAFTPYDIDRIVQTGTGISHCPSSNMRIAYGIAPVPAMIRAGAKVSIGVDGGASNDSGNFLMELREALLIHRIRDIHPAPYNNENATSPYDILRIGNRGGASVLNRDDIGSLETGKAADIVLFDLNRIDYAGTHDPLAALLFCGLSHRADTTIVNGQVVVKNGKLTRVNETDLFNGAEKAASRLLRTCREKNPLVK